MGCPAAAVALALVQQVQEASRECVTLTELELARSSRAEPSPRPACKGRACKERSGDWNAAAQQQLLRLKNQRCGT